ncbi:MAG: hypothetical protein ACOC0Z_02820 [Halohasta sp.]
MVNIQNQMGVGIVLIVVGGLLFIPGVSDGSSSLVLVSLVAAALLLTVGTYLVGTSEPGRSV